MPASPLSSTRPPCPARLAARQPRSTASSGARPTSAGAGGSGRGGGSAAGAADAGSRRRDARARAPPPRAPPAARARGRAPRPGGAGCPGRGAAAAALQVADRRALIACPLGQRLLRQPRRLAVAPQHGPKRAVWRGEGDRRGAQGGDPFAAETASDRDGACVSRDGSAPIGRRPPASPQLCRNLSADFAGSFPGRRGAEHRYSVHQQGTDPGARSPPTGPSRRGHPHGVERRSLRLHVRLVASLHAAPPTAAADDRPDAPDLWPTFSPQTRPLHAGPPLDEERASTMAAPLPHRPDAADAPDRPHPGPAPRRGGRA